ncbi:Nramp family divalent metal transporter [Psychroserpens sp.]|uniref:Nramp family divalent metal transporter n=1 Tax=Psychroserpens sp. TaxID=2020870 RepID=UPI001AFFD2F4|nr:Nramp family divalent metal transporter [Psychroserpens sp.]MBO6606647.1 Nramp family divalent metal transporter [Psychroserpens sp.]MBO6653351.1 Nramp family divalent metal transporter [Psychroserpens sp.]MBO6680622.1 Nramp family divalent metal transporter [Psychroserpens sp.]MBO6750420.1 Nramp family divalent metal transporter [Psychroserpens sp.]MBO6914902.1 Nramp family divalent metal transporter [Psychroserpens sp.]
MIRNWLNNIGPGPLVAAAFIGPGTVTVCTLAGVNFGYALLWALLLSVFATIILQEMSARLGIVSQKGLSEVLREELKHPVVRVIALLLILSAIVIGNAAYEAGNISGGILGLESLFGSAEFSVGSQDLNLWSLLIGLLAFVLLYIGNYKLLERTFIGLVIVMSLAFIITTIITKPDVSEILKGLVIPNLSEENVLTVIALVGTTVVPYNLFLHASLVKEKWTSKSDLSYARKDTYLAVILGGVVSMCIVISASAIKNVEVSSAADLALGLEPLFGDFASYVMSIGLFAAGITSAITAPLAAAYVASGCLGWTTDLRSWRFRTVWMFILLLGVIFSSIGFKSIEIIKFAQVANGLLLPIIAGFLLWVMNRRSILGNHKNTALQNIFGVVILAITIFLGLKSILKVFNIAWL